MLTPDHLALVRELLERERRDLGRQVHHDPIMQAHVETRLVLIWELLAFLAGVEKGEAP
jgi:hypothetical protein